MKLDIYQYPNIPNSKKELGNTADGVKLIGYWILRSYTIQKRSHPSGSRNHPNLLKKSNSIGPISLKRTLQVQ